MNEFRPVFISPARLLPHEETVDDNVVELGKSIAQEGVWTTLLYVDRDSLVVMDGHHRRAVALTMALTVVPCLMLSYDMVSVVSMREGHSAFPEDIIARARQGRLFPPKTTKHRLVRPAPAVSLPLSSLRSRDLAFLDTLPMLARI